MKRLKSNTFTAIFMLAWPAVLEQMLQTIVQYVDTAMVGRLGTQATAAVGVTSTVTWLVNSPMGAVGVGFVALISRAMGGGEEEKARRAAGQAVTVSLLMGLLLGAVTLSASSRLPRWMGADPELWESAGRYFFIICTPMIFRTWSALLGSVLRASKDSRTPMCVNLLMNLVNVVLNFLLIYDTNTYELFGMRIRIWGAGMGVDGAAIATAVGYCLGGSAMLGALYASRRISPGGYGLRLTKDVMKPCFRVAFPMLLERVFTCLGHVVFSALVAGLGTLAFAAHTIALTAEEIFYIPDYGLQAAASALSGNACGAGDQKQMRQIARMLCLMVLVLMSISGFLLFLLAEQMMQLFIHDRAAVDMGAVLLRMVAVSEPLYGVSVILEGIFQGVGDTRHPFLYSITAMWGVRILFTWIGITFLGFGLYYVWGCMIANNVTLALLLLHHYFRGRWNPLETLQKSK